tara:strand:- start:261 stop:752 length:492 start_codon:yes stop_codon:yes gene_type:complete
MKRSFLLTLALITVGCAEPIPRNLDDLVQQGEDTYLDRETMRPYSGPVFRFSPNDTTRVLLSANLKDGKLDGPYEKYWDNGQLAQKANYVAGEWHGPAEGYHENGQLGMKVTYKDGEYDGLWEAYDENGQLLGRGTFNMGEECGEWFEDGETVTYDPCPPSGN